MAVSVDFGCRPFVVAVPADPPLVVIFALTWYDVDEKQNVSLGTMA